MNDNVCPVCDSNDSVQHIRTVVASGSESGLSTFGGMGLTGGAAGSFGVGISANQSQSGLVERFYPPKQSPDTPNFNRTILISLGGPFLTAVLAGVILQWNWAEAIFWGLVIFMLAWPVFMFIGVGVLGAEPWMTRRAQSEWNARTAQILNGYYCFRDDTAFNDKIYGTPEAYSYAVFTGE